MAILTRREALRLAAATGLVSVLGGPRVKAARLAQKEIALSPDYRDGVLAKGPVGYWRLGEDAGPTAFDETPNGYDGSYVGNPTFGMPGAICDDPDTAVQFNGTDYVEIPDSADFSQPTSGAGLTVEVWLRPDRLQFPGETRDPYVHWLGKGVHGQQEWALRFYSMNSTRPNRISAYIFNPNDPPPDLGAGAYFQDRLVVGQWMHVVACYQPGDASDPPNAGVQIYRDGHLRQGPPSSGTLYRNPQGRWNIFPVHGGAPLRLATRDLGSFLIGALDEVAIYPRVLSQPEIEENYLNGVCP